MLTKELQEKHEDPRITRTRQLLLEALGVLLREKSFEAITVREIAERATLNRVTFYAHFQDKYALLEYAIRSMIRQKMEEQLGGHSAFSDENLKKLILLVCSFLADIEHGCPPPRGQMEPLMEKQIKEEIYLLLQSWLKTAGTAANGAASKPSAEQAAMVSSWAIYGAALQWSQAAKTQPVEYFVRQVLPLIQNNLGPYFEKAAARNHAHKATAGRAPTAFLSSPLLSVYFQI
jgi:AcrR family transcriptional regulator